MEKRLRAVQAESKMEVCVDPVPTNDLEYEDKQKSQESQLVYDGLRFNLQAHSSKSLFDLGPLSWTRGTLYFI